ncbi:MAG: putative Ig domain-containing protein, partial [Planctomycetota bacterium]
LTFSLDSGAPSGAGIDPVTGVFTWTPSEAQGPGTFDITVRVTDDGTPNLSDSETITVTVGEVNEPPVLAAIGNKSVDEGSLLTFTASASDPDTPANTLTFSLDAGAPTGASIDANSGVFTWTPSEAQGPGTFDITVRVTDDGTPAQNSQVMLSVQVNDAYPWQYFAEPLDVNTDGFVSPLDVLIVINDLNARGARRLDMAPSALSPPHYIDVNGDGSVSPLDALVIINRLNAPRVELEGEIRVSSVVPTPGQSADGDSSVKFASQITISHVAQPLESRYQPAYKQPSTAKAAWAMSSAESRKATRHRDHRLDDVRKAENADLELALDMIADDVATAILGRPSLETGVREHFEALGDTPGARFIGS